VIDGKREQTGKWRWERERNPFPALLFCALNYDRTEATGN
jgi:hypothetical protein